MAEKTTTLRTLIPPLRRDAKLAPVADALENAQVQLDALNRRIIALIESALVTETSSVRFAASPTEPDGVTVDFKFQEVPVAVILNGQFLFEGDSYTRVGKTITLPYAPAAGDFIKCVY